MVVELGAEFKFSFCRSEKLEKKRNQALKLIEKVLQRAQESDMCAILKFLTLSMIKNKAEGSAMSRQARRPKTLRLGSSSDVGMPLRKPSVCNQIQRQSLEMIQVSLLLGSLNPPQILLCKSNK